MALPIPNKIPNRVFYAIAKNFVMQKIGSSNAKYDSAIQLQEILLSFLKEDCWKEIEEYKTCKAEQPGTIPRIIWIMWWQGIDTANPLISKCIERFRAIPGFQINILDKSNVSNFVDISDVLPLYEKGKLLIQHLADIIRIRLLHKYGGIWCDASMIVLDTDYFSRIIQNYSFLTNHFVDFNNAGNVSHGKCSTYFWATFPDNPFFAFIDDAFTGFLNRHEGVIDYTHFDYTIMLGYYNIPYIQNLLDAVPPNNLSIWWLDGHYSEEFDKNIWNNVIADTYLMKLSSKGAAGRCRSIEKNTFLDYVWNTYLEESSI